MDVFNRRYWSAMATGSAALALTLSGCAGNESARDPSGYAGSEPSAGPTTPSNDRETTVQISKAFRDRCSLPADTQRAPGFEFDKAALHARGRNVLDDVAQCLVDGPLQGEPITIIGRADGRGSKDYNEDLGATRAAAARNYLVQKGVPTDRMHLMSRGEEGARGNNEASWTLDRRVDLELGNLNNSPILQGTMIQAESAPAPKKSKAGTYADTADGPVGGSVTGPGSAAGSGK